MTDDLRKVVIRYVAMLSGPESGNAWHSLREMGEGALPYLFEAFEATPTREVQQLIGEVVCQLRVAEALPFWTELLRRAEPSHWKLALDGLVTLGDQPSLRRSVIDTLASARETANAEKSSWIQEAIEQFAR